MYEDKNLKKLLSASGLQKASPGFTQNVMGEIKRMQTVKYIQQPLVPALWIKVYRIAFITIIGLLVAIMLISELSTISIEVNFEMPLFVRKYGGDIFIYIIAFWMLILFKQQLNARVKNKPLHQ